MTNPDPVLKERTIPFPGLTAKDVEASRQRHGTNVLTPPERTPWWRQWLQKFDNPIIRILIIAAVVAIGAGVVDGKYIEGVGIMVAVMLATTLAFFNEYRANREFDILNKVNDEVPIKVIRDENFTTVARQDLVVGDIVLVEVGDEVPADGRALEAVSLQVDESRLTGESAPVSKVAADNIHAASTGGTAYPPDRLLRSAMVTDGHGVIEVAAVGDSSEVGKTARAATEEAGGQAPLDAQLERLTKLIGVLGLGVSGLVFVALVARGAIVEELQLTSDQWYFFGILVVGIVLALTRVWLAVVYDAFEILGRGPKAPSWLETDHMAGWGQTVGLGLGVFLIGLGVGYGFEIVPSSPADWLPSQERREILTFFMISVAVIVIAVPEGLPMSVTLSLAYSMRRMTASNSLVRRMQAVETVGAATVICSDKTGTLTMNEMRVAAVEFPGHPGDLVAEAISANSTANLDRLVGGAPRPLGNPTEGALLAWLEDQGIDYIRHRNNFTVDGQWTFSTERKFMGTLGASPVTGASILHVKGAPGIIMGRCSQVLTDQGVRVLDEHRATIEGALIGYQARGMRTIGFAYREAAEAHQGSVIEEIASDMTWLGFAAIADPVRPEVPAAVQACRDAGIMVKVVTGDNPETAREIARQIGLWEGHEAGQVVLIGQDFAQLGEEEAHQAADDLKVLARARPMDKMRLVRLLREQGQIVAVTGDGTNDAPALNYAHVGLAMGKAGTAVAKEVSDIVLLDDSFRSIVNAIMWGRSLYENIQRFILYQLTVNVVALGAILLGPLVGVKLPLTVIQLLWINLIMDTFAALALATEPPHWDVMKRPPRNPNQFIISKPMARNIFFVGSIFFAVVVAVLLLIRRGGVTGYELSAFFTVFVMLQFWNLFNAKSMGRNLSVFSGMRESKAFLAVAGTILLGQILFVQFGGSVFRTTPLSVGHWVIIVCGTSAVLWVGELWRLIMRLRYKEEKEDIHSPL